ncbi:hypothetical protein ACJX0J_030343 [Zea mays]
MLDAYAYVLVSLLRIVIGPEKASTQHIFIYYQMVSNSCCHVPPDVRPLLHKTMLKILFFNSIFLSNLFELPETLYSSLAYEQHNFLKSPCAYFWEVQEITNQ